MLVLAASLAAAGCAAPHGDAAAPSGERSGAASLPVDAGGAAPSASRVGDITHIKQVLAYLGTPGVDAPRPVYFFGDSTTREAIVSEAKLAASLLAAGGGAAQPFVLTSRNQTFPLDEAIAAGLPSRPALALIGVGLSRFTNPPAADPSLGESLGARSALSPWAMHHYSATDILTAAQKRSKVQGWLAARHPLFKKNEPLELARLKQLAKACLARGWTVAFVDMPTNVAIIRGAFDAPKAQYRAGCAALAAELGVTYLRFTGSIGLKNTDFYDLIHLVGSAPGGGRAKFTDHLALKIKDMVPAAQP